MLWTMVVTKITKRKRNLPDWTDDDFRVFDLTEDESDAMSISDYDPDEEGKESVPNLVLSDDEDERKLRSFSSAEGSLVVKYTRKSRVHGQIPTITELANELERVPSQIVLPVHSIQPTILVNRLYLKFSAEAVEVRVGDNLECLVHEWPLENIDGIGIHYCSDWEEDTRAFVTVRVSAPLSSLPRSSRKIDEFVLELLKFGDSLAGIFELSPVYGEIIEELKKEDVEKTVRPIEMPNSPTCTSLSTSLSEEEDLEKVVFASEMPTSKASTSFLTSSSEEEDLEKAVFASEVPNSKASASLFASSSKEFDNGIAAFKGLVYPRADPDAVTITQKDLKILKPFEFLNDSVIDFYIKKTPNITVTVPFLNGNYRFLNAALRYLQETIVSSEKLRTLHFFNSFFFSKLAEAVAGGLAAFERVKKWTKNVNVFEKDFVFIPVNQSLHWSLIIICHPGHMWDVPGINGSCDGDACILHLDSMEGCHRGVEGHIRNYLLQEWLERNKDPEDRAHAERFFSIIPFRCSKVPQQDNSCDCGLFLLHYVELFLKTAPSIYRTKRQSNPPTQFLRRNWFKPSEASAKRLVIQKLILELSQDRSFEICRDNLETEENATMSAASANEEVLVSMNLPDDAEKLLTFTAAWNRVDNDSPHLLESQIDYPSRCTSGGADLDDDSSRVTNSDRREDYAKVQHAEVSIDGIEFDDKCRCPHHIGSDQLKVSYEPGTNQSGVHVLVVDNGAESGPVTVTLPDDETLNFEKCPVPRLPMQVKPLRVPSLLDDRLPVDRQPSAIVDLGTQDSSEINHDPSCSLSNRAARASEDLLAFDSILSPEEEDGMYESSYCGGNQRRSPSNLLPVGHVRVSSVRSVQSLYSNFFKEDECTDVGGRRPVSVTNRSSPLGRCSDFSLQCGLNFGQRKPTEDRVLIQKDSNQPYGFRGEVYEIQDLSSDDSDSSKKWDFKKKTPESNVKQSARESGKRVTRSSTQSSRGLTLSSEKLTKRNALNDLLSRRNCRRS